MLQWLRRYQDVTYAAMRIVLAFLFLCHGLQKLVGAFGGPQMPLASMLGVASVIETIGGVLIGIGLLTTPVALISAGEMAAAYFIAHAPRGGLPIQNQGELAVLNCFAFLYIASRGAGRYSVDAIRSRGITAR